MVERTSRWLPAAAVLRAGATACAAEQQGEPSPPLVLWLAKAVEQTLLGNDRLGLGSAPESLERVPRPVRGVVEARLRCQRGFSNNLDVVNNAESDLLAIESRRYPSMAALASASAMGRAILGMLDPRKEL
jgi:hypothetical protein